MATLAKKLKQQEAVEQINFPQLSVVHKAENLYDQLVDKTKSIAVVGLGYVGLPIALEFAKKFAVVGFDINPLKVEMLLDGIDPAGEVEEMEFRGKDISFTAKDYQMAESKFYVIAVPTPVDANNVPDLTPLQKATTTVGSVLKEGDYVLFESTVYPGCTEEICIPILERTSGLKLNKDFKIGFSPERINPGDKVHTLTKITKVVSGSDKDALDTISKVYGSIIDAGVHEASNIKVAEASKIIENTQRDVNIAFMNELSQMFDRMDIDTQEVIKAASTKWNFLQFRPGLVGGHCIGVDPYYLIHQSQKHGYTPAIISSARRINDVMPNEIADKLAFALLEKGKDWAHSSILVKGITFKEDVSDIRNSKIAELVNRLQSFGIKVEVEDPHADAKEVQEHFGFELTTNPSGCYDVVVYGVGHKEYLKDSAWKDMRHNVRENTQVFDVSGKLKEQVPPYYYNSL